MKYVRTLIPVTFRDDAAVRDDHDVYYSGSTVGAGFICQVVLELDYGDLILQSVKYPEWTAEVNPGDVEEIPAMEFLAEVHAGNIPEEALEASPCE